MSAVFLILSCTNYEGCTAIRAYESEADAIAFVDACVAYKATRPPEPEADLDAAPAAWDRWFRKLAKCEKKHPAGADDDEFQVQKLELIPGTYQGTLAVTKRDAHG